MFSKIETEFLNKTSYRLDVDKEPERNSNKVYTFIKYCANDDIDNIKKIFDEGNTQWSRIWPEILCKYPSVVLKLVKNYNLDQYVIYDILCACIKFKDYVGCKFILDRKIPNLVDRHVVYNSLHYFDERIASLFVPFNILPFHHVGDLNLFIQPNAFRFALKNYKYGIEFIEDCWLYSIRHFERPQLLLVIRELYPNLKIFEKLRWFDINQQTEHMIKFFLNNNFNVDEIFDKNAMSDEMYNQIQNILIPIVVERNRQIVNVFNSLKIANLCDDVISLVVGFIPY